MLLSGGQAAQSEGRLCLAESAKHKLVVPQYGVGGDVGV
jgi:hypothetical protein